MPNNKLISSDPLNSSGKPSVSGEISIQLIRHATLLIQVGPYQFLVDPMLSPKYAMEPVQNTSNSHRIPMTDLPYNAEWINSMVDNVNAVIITHVHRDHWDNEAQEKIPKDKFIFCQPSDIDIIKSQGFLNVTSFEDLTWNEINFHRTEGQHGTGEIGKKMGIVSGVIIVYKSKTIYLAGDSIWCDEVKNAIDRYRPNAIVVNSGAAQFLTGEPITMDAEDVLSVVKHSGKAKIIAVHMDTVNHCHLTRTLLKGFLESENMINQVQVPLDGDIIIV